jgi:antibiotic biosynthesis monooxygenase (ABM) superfamily enzyme
MIDEFFKADLTEFDNKSEAKPYEFNLSLKRTDMNQLFNDLKALTKNNWKIILLVALVLYFVSNYTDIKSGLLDGWNSE